MKDGITDCECAGNTLWNPRGAGTRFGDRLELIVIGLIALIICSIGFLLASVAVALVIGPLKFGVSLHPALWLVRFVFGNRDQHAPPGA